MLRLQSETGDEWVARVREDFTTFLQDHAACERKAQATAMSFIANYPSRSELIDAMTELAVEELDHFRRVHELLRARGDSLAQDRKSEYVAGLRGALRQGSQDRFVDRLLIAGIIEARSCERLGLIGRSWDEPEIRDFYRELAICEARHHATFVDLAKRYEEPDVVDARLAELLDFEARVLAASPKTAHVHG